MATKKKPLKIAIGSDHAGYHVKNKLLAKSEIEKTYLKSVNMPWFELMDLPRMPQLPSWENPSSELIEYNQELNFDPVSNQRAIECPTLVILGTDDRTVPPGLVEDIWQESEIEGLEVVVVDGLGHDMRIKSGKGRKFSQAFLNTESEWLKNVLISE